MLKSNLYLIPENTFISTTQPPEEAHIAIFIGQEDNTPEAQNMLRQILSAVKVNMDSDCIVCVVSRNTESHYYNAISGRNVSKILTFGLSADNLSIHIKPKTYTKFYLDQKTWIFSDSLQSLLEEKEKGEKRKRGALWVALKDLFGLV